MPVVMRQYYVYILTNEVNKVLYIGVTGDLRRRMLEHREKMLPGFSARYNVKKLVYFEAFEDIWQALEREKQLKAGSRARKVDLIQDRNPEWLDLFSMLASEG